jgi:hypothetical protein
MCAALLTLPIASKRDAVGARQRARQVAAMLGFDPADQTLMAAAVFEMARAALLQTESVALQFLIVESSLHIRPRAGSELRRDILSLDAEPANGLHIEKPLPADSEGLSGEDLTWAVAELSRLAPPGLYDEFVHQNQELLQTLRRLRECQTELEQLKLNQQQTAAA